MKYWVGPKIRLIMWFRKRYLPDNFPTVICRGCGSIKTDNTDGVWKENPKINYEHLRHPVGKKYYCCVCIKNCKDYKNA